MESGEYFDDIKSEVQISERKKNQYIYYSCLHNIKGGAVL